MSELKVRLDHRGLGAYLKSGELRGLVDDVTSEVAEALGDPQFSDGEGVPVHVESYTSDRVMGQVLLRHPGAANLEAKYGILRAAAADSGLEVRGA